MNIRPTYFRPYDMPGVEGIHSIASTHAFPRHIHDHWVIGLVISGAKLFDLDGRRLQVEAGAAFVIPAGLAHTSRASAITGVSYRAWFVPAKSLEHERPTTDFSVMNRRIARNATFVSRLRAFDASVVAGATLLERETDLEGLLDYLRRKGVPSTSAPAAVGLRHPGLCRSVEYLRTNFAQPVRLDDLARIAGLSRYHFLRTFRRSFQLTPHAYLDMLRVERAKMLLGAGAAPASVAQAVGFSDQAHLSRRLKRLTALTPGQIRATRQ